MVDLFGGIAAGLEANLRAGTNVYQYIYVDKDDTARKMAKHRLNELHELYPHQLPRRAFAQAFSSLPHDVNNISREHLLQAGAANPHRRWVVVAGWPCQDFSQAGKQQGLRGRHAATYHSLIRILKTLQKLQPIKPPAYLLENAPMQHFKAKSSEIQTDLTQIWDELGEPVLLDAVQFGSRAYRLRNWWTNMSNMDTLRAVTQGIRRPDNILVKDILDPHHQLLRMCSNPPPYYPANQGKECEALPTLMATVGSFAFVKGKPGSLLNIITKQEEEPSARERELALGYRPDTTACPGITDTERCILLGRCMDANCLQGILATIHAVYRHRRSPAYTITTNHQQYNASTTWVPPAQTVEELETFYVLNITAQEPGEPLDIWQDYQSTLNYIKTNTLTPHTTDTERVRVQRRAARYVWSPEDPQSPPTSPLHKARLLRKMDNDTTRVVPDLHDRKTIVQITHEQSGHCGRKRTESILLASYWWAGMRKDVDQVVTHCATCDKVQQTFGRMGPNLSPLPIKGLFYRWGIDLFGPLPRTANDNT